MMRYIGMTIAAFGLTVGAARAEPYQPHNYFADAPREYREHSQADGTTRYDEVPQIGRETAPSIVVKPEVTFPKPRGYGALGGGGGSGALGGDSND